MRPDSSAQPSLDAVADQVRTLLKFARATFTLLLN